MRSTVLAVAFSTMCVLACGGDPPTGNGTPTVASVVVSPSTATLVSFGETVTLSATAQNSSGGAISGKSFSWSSSDAGVVSVSPSGLVTAVANGMATITATTDGVTGSVSLTVAQEVASVQITVPTDTLLLGEMVQLTAAGFDALGSAVANAVFTWESSNTSVAVVTPAGEGTGVSLGQVTILVTGDDVTNSAAINVAEQFFYNTRSSSSASTSVLTQGRSYHIEIDGTWSVWIASTWSSGVCFGVADAAPIYPSPGVSNGSVGADPRWVFADPVGSSGCAVGIRRSNFEIRRDVAEGWLRDDPLDSQLNPDHRYVWGVEGRGATLQVRIPDIDFSDNYGQVRIRIVDIGPT